MVTQDHLTVFDILSVGNVASAVYPGIGTLTDIVNFGFAYVESQDSYVTHIAAHPKLMHRVLSEVKDAVLDPNGSSLGKLGTADLMTSRRMHENTIVFSNMDMGIVLSLKIKSDQIE